MKQDQNLGFFIYFSCEGLRHLLDCFTREVEPYNKATKYQHIETERYSVWTYGKRGRGRSGERESWSPELGGGVCLFKLYEKEKGKY